MESPDISIGLAIVILLGAIAVALLRVPLSNYLQRRMAERELRRLFAATARQRQLENINARRDLYQRFRTASIGLVEELANGTGRWGVFYEIRDHLRGINSKATPGVASAARQMCFACQVMLNEGFSDRMTVRFKQALQRFDAACREDLALELDQTDGSLDEEPESALAETEG